MVGVLVLVDEYMPESTAVGLAHFGERLEKMNGGHDEVVEVEGVGLAKPGLVDGVALGIRALEVVARFGRCGFWVEQFVLAVADPVKNAARRITLRIKIEIA